MCQLNRGGMVGFSVFRIKIAISVPVTTYRLHFLPHFLSKCFRTFKKPFSRWKAPQNYIEWFLRGKQQVEEKCRAADCVRNPTRDVGPEDRETYHSTTTQLTHLVRPT
ncbi:hypothetical protein Y032_0773g2234 [Ancylostoma ceylanicum]|uniref:Uncharacterized protein n=1 Tax=Ancylostoma ceylanicum TaxID=53326 RepID=A0A016WDG0_9BILA|nr:hypothetical protein Y032_0773g2234 [Ancylostoma ceylanicum]